MSKKNAKALAPPERYHIRLAPGERLFKSGEKAETMFVIVTGTVTVCDEKETPRVVAELGQGELIGERVFFENGPHTRQFSVYAKSDVSLLEIDKHNLQYLQGLIPDFSLRLIRVLMERLDRSDELIDTLRPLNKRSRLVKALGYFIIKDENIHDLRIKGKVIAASLEQIHETTNLEIIFIEKCLKDLCDRKILKRSGVHFVLVNQSALDAYGKSDGK